MPESRKESVYFAKQAERNEEMVEHMNLVASSDQAAVVEVNAEKDLLLDNPINTSIGEDESPSPLRLHFDIAVSDTTALSAAPQITIQDVFRLRKIGGGIGDGLDIAGELPLLSIDDDSKDDLPDLSPADFCQEYRLSNDICDLLIKHGYDPIGSLLDVKESELKSLGFKIGHNAELRWALKKMMLAKFGTVPIRNEEGKYKPILIGGTGGDGGPGGHRGGQGGVGKSHRIGGAGGIDIKDLSRFTGFRGGIAGAGGWGGVIYEGVGTNGIPGSHGKAVRMFIWQVSFFEEIMGGIGGAGGPGLLQGGRGGDGECVKFPTPLLSIDNEKRSWLLPTKLQDLNLEPELRQLLEEQGFHSVGGLFEAYDTDLLDAQGGPLLTDVEPLEGDGARAEEQAAGGGGGVFGVGNEGEVAGKELAGETGDWGGRQRSPFKEENLAVLREALKKFLVEETIPASRL